MRKKNTVLSLALYNRVIYIYAQATAYIALQYLRQVKSHTNIILIPDTQSFHYITITYLHFTIYVNVAVL